MTAGHARKGSPGLLGEECDRGDAIAAEPGDIELVGRRAGHPSGHGAAAVDGASRLHVNLANRAVRLLVGVFIGAQLSDVATTNLALQQAGLVENNPIFRLLFRIAPLSADLLKLGAAAAVVLLVLRVLPPARARQVLIVATTISLAAPLLNLTRLLGA